mmetsp:Transcript_8534/g.20970  ORF Transcript_8534/g.20970 Transcript_8534/m.20970 type:complete len:95 (-) Transcript_8534:503-787(-)
MTVGGETAPRLLAVVQATGTGTGPPLIAGEEGEGEGEGEDGGEDGDEEAAPPLSTDLLSTALRLRAGRSAAGSRRRRETGTGGEGTIEGPRRTG